MLTAHCGEQLAERIEIKWKNQNLTWVGYGNIKRGYDNFLYFYGGSILWYFSMVVLHCFASLAVISRLGCYSIWLFSAVLLGTF